MNSQISCSTPVHSPIKIRQKRFHPEGKRTRYSPHKEETTISYKKLGKSDTSYEKEKEKKEGTSYSLKKNMNTSRPFEHPPVRGEKKVETFRRDHRLQRQNLFNVFKVV